MKRLLYIFIVLLLSGCHDDYWELGDSYVYNNGCIYYVISVGLCDETYEDRVPFNVINFGFDGNYIIAYQKPDSTYFRDYYIDDYKMFSDSTIRSQETTDSLVALLNKMLRIKDCYWIVRKQDSKVFGPMSELDFKRKCEKMRITLKWVRE